METTTFLASCEQRGIAVFLNTSGEIDCSGPNELLTDRFRGILRDYAGLLRPVLSVPVDVKSPTDAFFDALPGEEAPAPVLAPVKEHSGVQLTWEAGRRIPWMAVCWIGKDEDDYLRGGMMRHHGFGDSKAGALKDLLARMGSIGTWSDLRRIVGRVYAELESLTDAGRDAPDGLGSTRSDSEEPCPEGAHPLTDLATTDHGLPPVFTWGKKGGRFTLSVRFGDGLYLEAKGAGPEGTPVEAWDSLQRHPAATPEQQWWLQKASPLPVSQEGA